MNWINKTSTIAIALIAIACTAQTPQENAPFVSKHPEHVNKYWYAGKGELNHYDLAQNRYGEVRKGEAVLVYVTEDFLPNKQVKKEFGSQPGISVLKLNKMKKFVTGIYDYSLMTSIFTPMDFNKYPATLKATFSGQDWCGQSFSQMNLRERRLEYQVRSYFQNEGDSDTSFPATYVEEDLWTRARIEPQMLPMGKIDMLPSMEYMRLKHVEQKPYKAEANLVLQVNDNKTNEEFYIYTLRYPELKRSLTFKIQSSFPYKILSWEETWNYDKPGNQLKTTATLTHTDRRAYWQEHSIKNETLRDSLGLQYGIMK